MRAWIEDKHGFVGFYSQWHRNITGGTSSIADEDNEDAVYEFLLERLTSILDWHAGVRRPGQAGWAFRYALDAGIVFRAVAWASGCSEASQTTPSSGPNEQFCQFWPCLVACAPDDVVPFYCPALAMNRARPWFCHRTRAYLVTEGVAQLLPLSPPADGILALPPPRSPQPPPPPLNAPTGDASSSCTDDADWEIVD